MIVWVAVSSMEYEGYGSPTLWSTDEKAKAWVDERDPPKSKAKKRQWQPASEGAWFRFSGYAETWEVIPMTVDDPDV